MTETAILDGDILAYRAAFWADTEGGDWLESRIHDDVKRWTPPGINKVVIALSCRRDENFRRDYLPSYKMHRTDRPTPDNLPDALGILTSDYVTVKVPRLEADDLMGIEKSALRAVCVTIDKDLQQVPGYWWLPPVDPGSAIGEIQYTTVEQANWWFHRQWITGDSTDNVAGIWKMGPKKAETLLNETLTKNHTALCLALYETRKNREGQAYTYEDAMSMARAVRILRDGEDTHPWEPLSDE